ncbi:MAG TPA: DUF1028 domain-containing protein [Gaiellales bacterium]|nr:DUF1028 domain-containing protein [Gaiellales bacterium]
MTFSLVACDLEAREWGVAVASKFLAVGSVVPWGEGEVGAVATQSYANVTYGPDGLTALRAGASAEEAMQRLLAPDPDREQRQVGIVDGQGRGATFTGGECFDWAGGRTGDCYAAQGNILTGADVVDALADTFSENGGSLAERLLAALTAADRAGGDSRGRQSASMIVRKRDAGYGGNNDILVDLRVDDHPDPVIELARLYEIHDLLFGRTPEDQLIPLEQVQAELGSRLGSLGFDGELEPALAAWAGGENLEERLAPGTIDPVVLRILRERSAETS